LTWFIVGYAALAYWFFWAVLRHFTHWDSNTTILLNSALALTVGPVLLVPAVVCGWLDRASRIDREHREDGASRPG